MRIALLSDIHGNCIALDAVLKDIDAVGGVDSYWILGDLVAIGPQPVAVLERLAALPDARFVRGNTDRYTTTKDRPIPTPQQVKADWRLLPRLVDVAHSFAWTQGAVTGAGWFEWLTSLPLEQRLVLPNGSRLLGVHASPGSDGGAGLHPALEEADLRTFAADSEADIICVGHTHWPMDTSIDSVRLVNLGCVSNPLLPDLRASYVILEADSSGYSIQHRRVDYDREAVIAEVERIKHPSGHFIVQLMRGEIKPGWRKREEPPWI